MPDLKHMISGSRSLAHPSVTDFESSHGLFARARAFAHAAETELAKLLEEYDRGDPIESEVCREFAVMYAQLAQAQRALEA